MATLNLVLSPPYLQRLHDALVCLGKFSEYVTIEASQSKFSLIALNSSKSAHGLISLLGGKFFDTYHFIPTSFLLNGVESKFTCRLLTKALLSVFRQRYIDSRDKETAIEKCELTMGDKPTTRGECRLLVRLICKHGVVKLYKLNYEDVDVMHAIFDLESAYNHWKMNAKLLKEYLEHFGPKAEQLDISVENGRTTLTSFTEKLMDGIEILKQPLHTAISMDTIEFEEITVEEQLHITINLKDFKAVVSHAETMNASMTAYYSDPGRPLQVQYDGAGVRCEFTLMTIGGNVRSIAHISPRKHAPPASPTPRQLSAAVASQTNIYRDRIGPSQAAPESFSREEFRAPIIEGNSQEPASLFFPLPDDEEAQDGDGMNEDPDDDFLGWDVNMDQRQRLGIGLHNVSTGNARTENQQHTDAEMIGPTQQVSQARGLFD